MREDGDPNFEFTIGSLDQPNAIAPMTEQSGIESRVAWYRSLSALPERTTSDDRTPEDLTKLQSLQHPDHDTEHWP